MRLHNFIQHIFNACHFRELGDVKGVNRAHPNMLVVASPVIERRECKIIEDEVSVEGETVEPKLISEADACQIGARRRGHTFHHAPSYSSRLWKRSGGHSS
jgi:hypothetical protein